MSFEPNISVVVYGEQAIVSVIKDDQLQVFCLHVDDLDQPFDVQENSIYFDLTSSNDDLELLLVDEDELFVDADKLTSSNDDLELPLVDEDELFVDADKLTSSNDDLELPLVDEDELFVDADKESKSS